MISALIPPIVYRFFRCSSEDVEALTYALFPKKSTTLGQEQNTSSNVLGYNILLSEMFYMVGTPLPSEEELEEITETYTRCIEVIVLDHTSLLVDHRCFGPSMMSG